MRPLVAVVSALSIAANAAAQGVTVRGLVYDSLHSRPLAEAFVSIGARTAMTDSIGRFAITDVAPGSYRVTAQHDAVDRLGISAIGAQVRVTDGQDVVTVAVPSFKALWRLTCGQAAPIADTGFVFGTVRASAAKRSAAVSVSWIDVAASGTKISQKLRTLEVSSDSLGNFALCGVPTTTGLTIRAFSDSLESGSFDVGPMDRERVLRHDLTLFDPASVPKASFTGRVVADSGGGPLARAEIAITDLDFKATTNEQGAFSFSAVPPGSHQVYVRRIGYGEVELTIDFHAAERVNRDIVMTRITVLDSMSIKAKPLARNEEMRVFEEHRKIGLGKFITAEELEKHRALPLSSLIRQWPGVYIPSSHIPALRDPTSSRQRGCKIALYLDGVKLDRPFDEVPPETLAGLEFYASAVTAPIEYARAGACGVILLHSRYKTGK